jgi:hypothetical protein
MRYCTIVPCMRVLYCTMYAAGNNTTTVNPDTQAEVYTSQLVIDKDTRKFKATYKFTKGNEELAGQIAAAGGARVLIWHVVDGERVGECITFTNTLIRLRHQHFNSDVAVCHWYCLWCITSSRDQRALATSHTLMSPRLDVNTTAGITIAEKGELGGPGFGGCPVVSHSPTSSSTFNLSTL